MSRGVQAWLELGRPGDGLYVRLPLAPCLSSLPSFLTPVALLLCWGPQVWGSAGCGGPWAVPTAAVGGAAPQPLRVGLGSPQELQALLPREGKVGSNRVRVTTCFMN